MTLAPWLGIGKDGILPSEVCYQDLPSVSDIKDLYSAVRGAGGESSTVVIHLGIVLKQTEQDIKTWSENIISPYTFCLFFNI